MDLLGLDEMLEETSYDQIYEKLQNQRCILVLGPNLATIANPAGELIPIRESIASELAKFLTTKGIPFDASQQKHLDYIALRCANSGMPQLAQDRLKVVIQNAYNKNAANRPAIYDELAKLPFHLIINTSPDNYMLQALGDKAQASHYNYLRNNSQPIGDISPETPLVYNLFGVYSTPESMVISKADQVEFINKQSENAAKIPLAILQHLTPDNLYLFLGFNTSSWHLPLLFRILGFHQHSAAFYYEEAKHREQFFEDLYRDMFKFEMKYESSFNFAKSLAEGYPAWSEKNAKAAPPPRSYVSMPDCDPATGKTTILLMNSNPKDTAHLNLNKEINMIKMEELPKSNLRDKFRIELALDVNKATLSALFGGNKPHIVHFSGHGESNGLLFYSDEGYSDAVSGEALGKVMRHHSSISCVVLSACYSQEQAIGIAQYIPNVIGTNGAIGDEKAIAFGQHFYRALFMGKGYEDAFRQAIDDLGLFLEFTGGTEFVFYKDGQAIS